MPEPADATRSPGRRLKAPETFVSLRHRNFRLLWITSIFNAGSNWIQQVTLGWLAYDLTGSALVAGVVFGMRALPSLLIGPIGGVLGDRFERKRGVQFQSGYMAVLATSFAFLLTFGDVHPWHIILFTFLQGVGQALVGPVRQAMVANTVPREDLANAIALNSFAQNLMRVIGPSIAGLLIAVSGPAVNFGIQGAAYVITFVLVLPLQTPYNNRARHSRRSGESLGDSFFAGFKYLRQEPTLKALILLALVPVLFTTPINLGLLPVFAKERLGVGGGGLGMLYSAQGIGAVIGTLMLASFSNFRNKGLLLSLAICFLTVNITFYSQLTSLLVALPVLATATCCFMTFQTLNQTIIQTVTPDEYLGRVMGFRMMDQGLQPLGSLVFGTLAEFYGIQTAIIIAGICAMISVSVILISFPSIRRYRSVLTEALHEVAQPDLATRPLDEVVAAVRPASSEVPSPDALSSTT
jgi:MFS family permease